MFDAAVSPFLVGMHDDFGIAASVKAMAATLQCGAQLQEIIDLAVKGDSDIARFVVNRLLAAGKIDDAETPDAKNDLRAVQDSFPIGAAVHKRVHHLSNALRHDFPVCADHSANAAHLVIAPVAL